MKHIFAIFCVLTAIATSTAQTKVPAKDIIRQINEGRPVEYNNVIIEGDLDLTDLENRDSDRAPWFSFNDDTIESFVGVSLKFTDCTFLGDVLAYYHIERRDETYVAHFEKGVMFKNCIFKRASEFKYSKFQGAAIFAGCTFNEDANFKYSKFFNGPLFNNVTFESGADFKYAKFPGQTSFEKATFQGLANFKYTKFEAPLNMKSVAFEGSEDFKYTKVDGHSFESYLLTNR